jgi:hypothetical protein
MQMKFCLHIWFPCDDLFKMSLILDILKFISKKLLTGSTEFFLLFGYVVRTTCPCSFAIYRAWFIKFFQIYLNSTFSTITQITAVESLFTWSTISPNLEERGFQVTSMTLTSPYFNFTNYVSLVGTFLCLYIRHAHCYIVDVAFLLANLLTWDSEGFQINWMEQLGRVW